MDKWTVFGKISSSSYRKRILLSLMDANKTPKEIAKDSSVKFSHVSNVLRQLMRMKTIKCLTPDLKKGRIYSMTAFGKEIARSLK